MFKKVMGGVLIPPLLLTFQPKYRYNNMNELDYSLGNKMFKSKNQRIVILALIDVIIVGISSLIALILRFNFSAIPNEYLSVAIKCLPVDALIAVIVLQIFKLYNRVWTYASVEELIDVLKASLVIEALFLAYRMLLNIHMPRSYFIFDWALLFMLTGMARLSKRFIAQIMKEYKGPSVKRRIMVIGAGAAGSLLIKELQTAGISARAACVIDDNPNKKGKYIHGTPIVGGRKSIVKNVEKYEITEIIIAMPSASPRSIKSIIEICNQTGRPVKILPAVSKSLKNSLSSEVRDVSYEDLLGREPIEINQIGIYEFIKDKTVMVTGGGGSIGSELCRQIVSNNPKKLIIFDIYENNAYEIQNEIKRHYPEVDVDTLIGSVRDIKRMEEIFAEYRPDIIYHAAAHKHVPLMEDSPNEAIKNNCKGTWNVAMLADRYKADNFILISTDKAVRPTNIMGASKRICEMIVQYFASKSVHTRYAAVRFGNVLGSNGSVIPLFLKQIENGGPVTVTHKNITRFFMTIPEAVALVLQAGLFAKGGEIFVLDMGEPVRIYELAENLIKMKGLVPGKDIQIEIVGLRPGEKLYEELLMDEEGLRKTENKLIYIGNPIRMDEVAFIEELDGLIKAAESNSEDIKERTAHLCGTYKITNN